MPGSIARVPFAILLIAALVAGCAAPLPSPAAPKLVCGWRVAQSECSAIESLVLEQVPVARQATAIVMADVCYGTQACPLGLHVVVALVVPRDSAVNYPTWPPTYFVENNSPKGDPSPLATTVTPWLAPVWPAFVALLRSAGFSDSLSPSPMP